MRNHQYLLSAAASAAAAGAILCGVLLFVAWAGWVGAAGLAAAVGLFFAWFYGGPRPDLAARDGGDHRQGSAGE